MSEKEEKKKPIRVWVDGCFDMMHWGHANFIRQARELGDYLICGVHSDEEIEKNKGPTVLKGEERYQAVEGCKWVDEVVRDAPYITSLEYLNKYNCDFCIHGDDLSVTKDGRDSYAEIKEAGKFRTVPRTTGVSTTDLVGRMLLLTREHHQKDIKVQSSPYTRVSQYLPTTRKIVQFSEGKSPKPNDKIVYIDGGFDLFHVGHISTLKKAKALGDFLIVGVHTDEIVNQHKGEHFPIMNLHERILTVLSCRYVDEVIIGAPFDVSEDLIKSMNFQIVCHGSTKVETRLDNDPYEVYYRIQYKSKYKSISL
eukprot:Anaeramoba_ignava/a479298_55.p1 GENE.a479298_55~~a479298_55.p1  ORF type:complete len:310 (-),score=72.94 a479298_55:320-1249(-)